MTYLLTISENHLKTALRKLKKTEGLNVIAVFEMLHIISVDCTEEVMQHVKQTISEVEQVEKESRKRAIHL